MAGIDNRIVTMKFDNRDFETNARTSMSTLQKLKESMNFGSVVGGTIRGLGAVQGALSKIGLKTPFAPMIEGANKGLSLLGGVFDKLGMKNPFSRSVDGAGDLQRAAQVAAGPAGMGVLDGAVTGVSNKFIALSTIAITALSNITNKAVNSATAWAKSFTVAPIMDGLREYELNLKSVQTVQANTDQPLPKINAALDQLNKYSDQTIYNFAEMARNVGTFTAAGVDLDTSVSSIKGIANLAALSGSSSEQAATAMYQLSQAIAAGKVGLMDWNSVVNAGMGGKKLQNALAQTAVAMGELDKNAVKMVGPMEKLTINGSSFRESIMAKPGEEAWLSSEALVNTLSAMDGRFSDAALAAEKTEKGLQKYTKAQRAAMIADARAAMEKKNGVKYTDEQFKALQKMSTMAFKSATEVKTLGQVFDVAKESIASGWAASFRTIFGDLKEAKALFTPMSNAINKIIGDAALARNTLLNTWADTKVGGRDTMIQAFQDSWKALSALLGAVKEGFRDIFPATTADDLVSLTNKFAEFAKSLMPSKDTLSNIRDIAGGVAAVFGIVKQIIVGVVSGFKALFDAMGAGNGSFLDFVAGIGRSVKGFHDFLAESGLITTFFETLGRILAVPLGLLKGLGGLLAGLFGKVDEGAIKSISTATGEVTERFSAFSGVAQKLRGWLEKVGEVFGNLGTHIGKALTGIGDLIANAFNAENFGKSLDVLNTTLLGGIVLLIRNFFKQGVSVDLTGGLFDGIKETLGSATQAFQNMQQTLKADILLKIAGAIAVMAAALLVLSMIDPKALTKALIAMTTGFGILTGALATLMKVMGPVGLVQMYVVTSAMTKMALSILLLAFALKIMSGIPFGDMLRGLIGLSAAMFVLQKAMIPMAAGSKGMAKAAWSLIMVGAAMTVLAVALKIMASMSWEELIRGLVGLTGTLLALAIGLKAMPELQAEALGLLALGVAVNLLAIALKIFATMSLGDMAKGLIMLAGSLLIIAAAIRLMPKTMLLQATALVAVAGAMVVLAGALKLMGSMDWNAVLKSLVLLAGTMLILAVGLNAIGVVGLVGAVALLATAGALAVLAPVMLAFGAMDWMNIIKSLTMLAGIFVVLGLAGVVLAPVVPVILALGAAMILLGAGFALLGAGALMAATAFGIVVSAGTAGVRIMADMIGTFIKSIPAFAGAVAKGFVEFVKKIASAGPAMVNAMAKIISNILDAIIKNVPKMGKAFMAMLDTGLRIIVQMSPKIFDAGLRLIIGFLEAIDKHIPRISDLAASIIAKFLNGIARNIGKIIQSGVNLIIKFINGVAEAIRNNGDRVGKAGANLGLALIEGMAGAISGGAGLIKDAAMSAASAAWEAAKDFFKINSPSKLMHDTIGKPIMQGWAGGMHDEAPTVTKEIESVGHSAMGALNRAMSGLDDAFGMDPNFNPTISPVLDLTALTQEANKMGSILSTAPIMPTVSYQAAADISAATQASAEAGDGGPGAAGGGDTYVTYEQHLHSPTPLDSVKIYRDGKSLISLKKEELNA